VAVPVASAHRFVRGHLLVIGANCEAAVDRGLPLLACATPPRHDRAPAQMTTAHRCGAPAKDEESRAVAATTQQTLRGSTTQLRRKPNNPCKSNKKKKQSLQRFCYLCLPSFLAH